MSFNQFAYAQLKRRSLVQRSAPPVYNSKFVLSSSVALSPRVMALAETMQRAAQSLAQPFYIHFKVDTDTPEDVVRYLPTILNGFNKSRVFRRARVSGLRMCNLYGNLKRWTYVSDMLVSSAFDAVCISSLLAEYSSVGSMLFADYRFPKTMKNKGLDSRRLFVNRVVERFWAASCLARHSVRVELSELWEYGFKLLFEPTHIAPISLLNAILSSNVESSLDVVEVGRNSRLTISTRPLIVFDDYYNAACCDRLSRIRYRRFSAFGIFYNNPDYPIY